MTLEQRKLEEAHVLLKKEDNQANLENRKLFQQLERVENELNRVNEDVAGTSKQILKQNVVRLYKLQDLSNRKKNKLSDFGIVLPDKKGGKGQLKGFIYPMIDDKLYEEH